MDSNQDKNRINRVRLELIFNVKGQAPLNYLSIAGLKDYTYIVTLRGKYYE